MGYFRCKACGAIDSRVSNGDNSICTECGSPDQFEEIEGEDDNKERS